MASVLFIVPGCPELSLFMCSMQAITERAVGAEGVPEGDRIRCGSALIVGPLLCRDSTTTVLVQWPDGLYQRLPYELRGFAASQKINGLTFS